MSTEGSFIPSKAINLVNLDLDEDSFCYLLEETGLTDGLKGFILHLVEFEENQLMNKKVVGYFRERYNTWHFMLSLFPKNLSFHEVQTSGWYILSCLFKLKDEQI